MHYPFNLVKENAQQGMGVVQELGFIKDKKFNPDIIRLDKDLFNIANYVREGIKDKFEPEEFKAVMEVKE